MFSQQNIDNQPHIYSTTYSIPDPNISNLSSLSSLEEKNYNNHLELVRKNGYNLKDVPEIFKDEEMCITALENNENSIQFIPYDVLTEKMCNIAIEFDGLTIKHIPVDFRTKKMWLSAFKNSPSVIKLMPKSVIEILNEELVLEAINHNPHLYKFIPEHFKTKKLRDYTISQDAMMILHLENPTPEEWDKALLSCPRLLRHIPEPSINQQIYAIKTFYTDYNNLIRDASFKHTNISKKKIDDNQLNNIKYLSETEYLEFIKKEASFFVKQILNIGDIRIIDNILRPTTLDMHIIYLNIFNIFGSIISRLEKKKIEEIIFFESKFKSYEECLKCYLQTHCSN